MARITVLLFFILAVAIFEVISIEIHICWRDVEDRGVGIIPKVCKGNDELKGALCYPKCQDGYYGVGPVCWQSCPPDYHDGGIFCWKGTTSFVKKTYTRSSYIPGCAEGEEEQLALCYKNCSALYEGIGPTCWQNAPDTQFPVACENIFPVQIKLPVLAYGQQAIDCTVLTAELSQAGNVTKECATWIATQGIKGLEQCIAALTKVIPDLATTKKCPPPTQ